MFSKRLYLPVLLIAVVACSHVCLGIELDNLTNPIWSQADDNVRDPAVLPVDDGYILYYSRHSGDLSWGNPANWSVAKVFTKDWITFESPEDITPKGYASPGDPIKWHGRYILPYQSYPIDPTRLCYSESADGRSWSPPSFFLPEVSTLPWNVIGRAIDPSLIVDGDTLHCFFVGACPIPSGGRATLLGHAITRDKSLKDWRILTVNAPLIGRDVQASGGVENVMVFKTGPQLWTMIYSEGQADQHLAYAQSPDLVNWTLKGPIKLPRQQWMKRRYGAPFVWREPDRWLMILMGFDGRRTAFGLLHSTDGINWSLLPDRKKQQGPRDERGSS